MNQFEYKKRYDPNFRIYIKKHIHSGEIHGGALTDIFKSIIGKTMKEAAKTGEHVGKKAGDKIIQPLSKKKNKITSSPVINQMSNAKPLSQYDINERVNTIISGGKLRKIM